MPASGHQWHKHPLRSPWKLRLCTLPNPEDATLSFSACAGTAAFFSSVRDDKQHLVTRLDSLWDITIYLYIYICIHIHICIYNAQYIYRDYVGTFIDKYWQILDRYCQTLSNIDQTLTKYWQSITKTDLFSKGDLGMLKIVTQEKGTSGIRGYQNI